METKDKYYLIIMRTKYLKNTLSLAKDIAEQAHEVFIKYLNVRMGIKNEIKDSSEKTSTNKVEQKIPQEKVENNTERQYSDERIEVEKEVKDENLKKVFRKIALKAHPDKLEGLSDFEKKIKEKLFSKARQAFQENDYYGIVEVAESLKIDLPPPTQKQIELMKKTNKNLEKEIDVLKKSVVWGWYHADEKDREKIMDQYVDYLQKNNTRT